jgi:AcrR family transcriptional regulator
MNQAKTIQNTEQNILNAAEKVFLEKGFDRATTTEIARLAGVTHAMLHYYYRTKENLFDKIFSIKVEELVNSLLFIISQDMPLKEKIKHGVETHFDFIAQNPKLPLFIMNEFLLHNRQVKTFQPSILMIVNQLYTSFDRDIKRELELGTIRPITAENLLYNIIALNVCAFIAQSAITELFNWNNEDYKQFIEERKKENVETILNGLRP